MGGTSGDRLRSLTALRFVAALAVFCHHGILLGAFADPTAASVYHALFALSGPVGVSFFFLLSGFVLTFSARPADTAPAFWRRRLVKIYPNHLVTFGLALALYAGSYTTVFQGALNLLLLQAWVPDHDVMLSVNAPSWSLSCEVFFYALFPLLLRGVRRIAPGRLWWWAGGVAVAVLAVAAVGYWLVPAHPAMPDGQPLGVWQFWFGYIFPPARALGFLLGMLLARIVLAGRWPRIGILPAALLFLVCYAGSARVPYLFGLGATTVLPLALLVAAVADSDLRGRPSPLRSRFAVWLGERSYAFYLVHGIVLASARRLLHTQAVWSTPLALGLLAVLLVESTVLAWLLHAVVEEPAMRRWSRPRRAVPPPVRTAELSLRS